MKTADLMGPDGKSIRCWEPRAGVYLAASAYTSEQAAAWLAAWWPPRCWTAADVESHRRTGYSTTQRGGQA